MTNSFQLQVEATLSAIDPRILSEDLGSVGNADLFEYEVQYAAQKQLNSTAIALPLVRFLMAHAAEKNASRFGVAAAHIAYYQHALTVAQLLINLHLPLSAEEEDMLLTAAICHIIPETIEMDQLDTDMTEHWHLSAGAVKIVRTVFWDDSRSGPKRKSYYDRVQSDKLALLLKLADRCNLVEQLYGIDSFTARGHIHETKTFFFPMCTYAKEWYPDLVSPVSIMMDKMRCLMDAADILLMRYEAHETSLSSEILELQEENAIVRGLIHALKQKGEA